MQLHHTEQRHRPEGYGGDRLQPQRMLCELGVLDNGVRDGP